jgi:hypothetical protein
VVSERAAGSFFCSFALTFASLNALIEYTRTLDPDEGKTARTTES